MTTMDQRDREMSRAERKWVREKELKLRKYKLRQEKKQIRRMLGPQLTTTKWLMAFLFVNCTVIEVFTGYVTIQNLNLARELLIAPDLTPLVTLIGAVVGEVVAFAVYMLKSMKENSVGGVVYEAAMIELGENAKG